MPKITSREFIKYFAKGVKFTVKRTWVRSDQWTKKGYSYTDHCKVVTGARRVRRQWNTPSSFIEATAKVEGGYVDITSMSFDSYHITKTGKCKYFLKPKGTHSFSETIIFEEDPCPASKSAIIPINSTTKKSTKAKAKLAGKRSSKT